MSLRDRAVTAAQQFDDATRDDLHKDATKLLGTPPISLHRLRKTHGWDVDFGDGIVLTAWQAEYGWAYEYQGKSVTSLITLGQVLRGAK